MKIRIIDLSALIALSLCASAVSAAGAHDAAKDEAEIRALIQGETDAYAKRDAAGAMVDYWDSDKLHVFDVMMPVQHYGYKDNLKSTVDAIDGAVGPVTMIWENPVVKADGDHAYSYAVVHMVATMKSGSKTDILIRNTDIWERMDGKWKIIHEHNSLPLDPAAGAKLVNATPR